eukprot:NODE_398_length_2300_cov_36.494003_g367_i0.p1 GENE.NODE_398_length_2300_cov_36.494003_g367_i0~~NODE_398_length_2300_cov_36.494003_g367_i0.p1  ORF type:complete len:721 (+),score=127.94 NODE_398_length_2300_cov_36.494003_g367_i0:38-2164(+)
MDLVQGWIANDLASQLGKEMCDLTHLGAKFRCKRLREESSGEIAAAAFSGEANNPFIDGALLELTQKGVSPLFRVVVQSLLDQNILMPLDVYSLMDRDGIAQFLKAEQKQLWKREMARCSPHLKALRRAKRLWRREATSIQSQMGMPTTGLTGSMPPGLDSRRKEKELPPALSKSPENAAESVDEDGKQRAISPDMPYLPAQVAFRSATRRQQRQQVEEILRTLSRLRNAPVLIEPLDLGNCVSLLITAVRPRALLALGTVLVHEGAMAEPFSTSGEKPSPPEPIKTLAVSKGFEEKNITFLTRPEEDQVEREVISLRDYPSVEGRREREMYWRVRRSEFRRSYDDALALRRFHWQAITPFAEFCPKGTVDDCIRDNVLKEECDKIHFRRLIFAHTDIELGDCSYLDTCRRLNICKFVHYQLLPSRAMLKADEEFRKGGDGADPMSPSSTGSLTTTLPTSHWQNDFRTPEGKIKPLPTGMRVSPWLSAQWIQCDLRTFDPTVLGKFDVIMADPPWDIHMELPYGTMRDDEMRNMKVGELSDEGLIFLWVTGRAMELGRECLEIWGYKIMEEIVWVKINQLQRIIRTGRTGHWLNHSKEHCLVGMKGQPKINRGVDCDVVASEVRETSRKPDEIYGMIERICPDGRKLEIFARNHNIHEGWLALGNQLDGVHITEPQLLENYNNWVAREMSKRRKGGQSASSGSAANLK